MASKAKPGKSGQSFWAENRGPIFQGVVGGAILLLGGYIAVQTRENAYELRRLDERQKQTDSTVVGIKQALIKIRLANDPKAAEIMGDLVVDQPTARGLDLYEAGKVESALAVWREAQKNGSEDASIALQAAGVGPQLVPMDARPPKERPEPKEKPRP